MQPCYYQKTNRSEAWQCTITLMISQIDDGKRCSALGVAEWLLRIFAPLAELVLHRVDLSLV